MRLEFYDENKKVKSTLFDEDAQKVANKLVGVDNRGNHQGVSRSQLRKIFDEVKRLKKSVEVKDNWDDVYPMVKMIKSKTAYSIAKAISKDKWTRNYYESLGDFIKSGINNIKCFEDLKVFCLLFEAVYGFYYELGGADKKLA